MTSFSGMVLAGWRNSPTSNSGRYVQAQNKCTSATREAYGRVSPDAMLLGYFRPKRPLAIDSRGYLLPTFARTLRNQIEPGLLANH